MKEQLRRDNVCEWEDGMCVYTIADIRKYINNLKIFSSVEEVKGKLTIIEHQAIAQEIQAWEDILGIISRLNVCN